jgi:bifunctional non-homologous end joining protein LigD
MAKATREKERVLKVAGIELTLTNQNKLYFPKDGITKGDVIDYYNAIYKYILPYLKDRPQSMLCTPNGVLDKGFYQKNMAGAAPEWAKTIKIDSDSKGGPIEYLICNDKATLLYMNNLGCIEINPWNSRIQHLSNPDYFVIDIDPADKNTFEQVIDVANVVHEILEKAKAPSFCKTSGATGLHIYVPLGAKYHYDQASQFANIIAVLANDILPKFTSVVRSLEKRGQKIYIDYLQNKRGQTLSSVYSLRPRPGATASTPLLWKEVKKGLDPRDFTIKTLPKRLEKTGDLFRGVLGKGIPIEKCLDNLAKGSV